MDVIDVSSQLMGPIINDKVPSVSLKLANSV